MTGNELRQKYLDFFAERGHKVIPPAPLVLQNDPTTLFTSSGMQPLVPYLLGQTHPEGKRLVDSQPSFRSQDIEEVGDNRHTTFFEMLGNWSLGSYFKKEQLVWFYEFLTKVAELDPNRIFVTVFEGDPENNIPKDEESVSIWKSLGVSEDHIYFYGVKKNWWSRSGVPSVMPAGEPGGPDSEVFYDFGKELGLHENSVWKDEPCHPNCDCGRFMEIGNSVFMQYQKQADGTLKELPQKNVDFGGGLERILAAYNNTPDVFRTDLFTTLVSEIETLSGKSYNDNAPSFRVIVDHIKAAVFITSSGVEPSNKQQGYMLRRLIRRAFIKAYYLQNEKLEFNITPLVRSISNTYNGDYTSISNIEHICEVINTEIVKFSKVFKDGVKEVDKYFLTLGTESTFIPATEEAIAQKAFDFYQSAGIPEDYIYERFKEQFGFVLKMGEFNFENFVHIFERLKQEHVEKSRTASKGMFKGGLADQSEITTKYHTTTHLIHQALRQTLGEGVHQVGSNITAERLRFDFTYPQALTDTELKTIENIVNIQIMADLPVTKETKPLDQARLEGALAFFGEKYPDTVTVYSIGSFSKEVCGGPHVSRTSQIGPIEIYKQEAIGAGKRRLYARSRP